MRESVTPWARVSAIIPVFNGERYLREAMESALSQDYPNLEVIVIDDGSTDGSAQIAQSYVTAEGHPLRYCHQQNAGLSAAQNAGVRESSGEYIAFLDCDDIWTPGKIRLQIEAFAHEPELDMVFGLVEQFISPELVRGETGAMKQEAEVMPGYSTGTLLARRDVFQRAGMFSSEFRLGEFLDWYARASDAGLRSTMLNSILLRRRIHKNNMGVRDRDKRADYLRVFKASLDRRRQAQAGAQDGGKGGA
jgi:glycosyltransferase involved in cell wall biosynthesis